MKKRQIITIIIALVAMTAGAQETNQEAQKKERTIALWGHVKNSLTRVGIKDVFITLMREDSTVVDTMHVFQQWSGRGKDDFAYRFNIPAREQQYIIRAEHPDYETTYVDYHVRHIARNTYFDAPWHYMKKRSRMTEDLHQLGEVVVRATKIKMTYRGDTITFNADAFNLPEGSMLDALIRQMDGVELKDDGRILVQGEQVDELMLNGKDFFKGNNRVMLDNLPAYTVQKVQTYHKSTEINEYLGRDYDKKRFVMDVQLKREYNQGWLANAEVAGGSPFNSETDERLRVGEQSSGIRYLARLFAMRHTDFSQFAIVANANNLDDDTKPWKEGSWQRGKTNDLRKTERADMDFRVSDRNKRWEYHGSASVNHQRTEGETRTIQQNYLPTGDTYDYWKAARNDGQYRNRKKAFMEEVQRLLTEYLPEIEGQVAVTDLATPLTYERYCGCYRGGYMGIWRAGQNPFAVPVKSKSVQGLRFAGMRTLMPGGLPISVQSGYKAAKSL